MWCERMTGLISLVKCRIYCSPFDRKWNKNEMILVPGVGLVQQDTASFSEKWMPGSRAYVLLFAQSGWRCYARYYSLGARRVKKQYWVSPLAAWHAFVFEHLFHRADGLSFLTFLQLFSNQWKLFAFLFNAGRWFTGCVVSGQCLSRGEHVYSLTVWSLSILLCCDFSQMDDIDAMFSDLLGEMDLLTQVSSVMTAV